MTLQAQIIAKQDEIIEYLLNYIETYTYTNFKNSHVGTMLILNELSALKSQLKEQEVSDDIKIAKSKDIFNRLVEIYHTGDYAEKAKIARICDEVLDRSGVLLGKVRDGLIKKGE